VNPGNETLEKGPDGLFRPRDAGAAPLDDPAVKVVSGALETSNVNAVEEMVQILALARQFEVQVKMMHTAEVNDEAAARLLQS
jgi:flagellar basal-body rod protein FlgF